MTAARALRGLGRIAATALVACALAWTLAELAPGSAAERAARAAGALPPDDASTAARRAEVLARVAARHDLGGAPAARIARRTLALAALDLGRSWRDDRPVATILGDALPVTARVAGLALALALGCGAAAGAAAARARGPGGAIAGALIAVAAAAPPAWLAIGLVGAGGRGEVAAALALAAAPAAVVAAQVRGQLAGFLAGPLAAAARARGAGEARVAWHGLAAAAPALAPLLTSVGAYALGAAVVVERAFALPGLGRVTLDAAARGDAPVLAGVAAVSGAIVAALSVAADALARAIDPRLGEAA